MLLFFFNYFISQLFYGIRMTSLPTSTWCLATKIRFWSKKVSV